MRPSRDMTLTVVLAICCVALAGCVAAPAAPVETPAASPSAVPTPTPTVEPIVIGPAEMPPVVFDGDCLEVLSAGDLAEVIGVDFEPGDGETAFDATANVGGLGCEWVGADGEWVGVSLIPQAGLDGAEIPAEDAEFYFEECRWSGGVCSWQGDDDSLWVGISFSAIAGMAHEKAAGWGEDLGQRILENHAAAAAGPWTRDRDGWWPALDCERVAAAVGAQLGASLTGEPGYEDLLPPGALLEYEATGHSDCALLGPDGEGVVRVLTWPGLGAAFSVPDAEPVDSGVPGISMLDCGGAECGGEENSFRLSDGVNRVDISASESVLGTPYELAVAVAAASASGFR